MPPASPKINESIQLKIDAARYFLSKMKETEDEVPIFRFNLEAFLCLADSARDLIKESGRDWYLQQPVCSDNLWIYVTIQLSLDDQTGRSKY